MNLDLFEAFPTNPVRSVEIRGLLETIHLVEKQLGAEMGKLSMIEKACFETVLEELSQHE